MIQKIEQAREELRKCRSSAPSFDTIVSFGEYYALLKSWRSSSDGTRAAELVDEIELLEAQHTEQRRRAVAELEWAQRLGALADRTFYTWKHGADDFQAERERLSSVASRWVEGVLTGVWAKKTYHTFVLSSPATGVGKTHLSLAVLHKLAHAGLTWQRWNVVELLSALRSSSHGRRESLDAARILADCQRCDVLCLDDLGTQRGTDWELERLYEIVNARWERGLWNLATANASEIEHLVRGTDGNTTSLHVRRIVSRLSDGLYVLTFGSAWPDWRLS